MKAKDYPSIPVETKYGTLTMTFLSPRLEMKSWHDSVEGHVTKPRGPVARVSTDDSNPLIINRIPVKLYFGIEYGTSYYQKGVRGEEAITEMRQSQGAYNRRVDGSAWDYNAGYAKMVWTLTETVLREAYEAHPELAAEAETIFNHNVAADAFKKVEEAKDALKKAEAAFYKAWHNVGEPRV